MTEKDRQGPIKHKEMEKAIGNERSERLMPDEWKMPNIPSEPLCRYIQLGSLRSEAQLYRVRTGPFTG